MHGYFLHSHYSLQDFHLDSHSAVFISDTRLILVAVFQQQGVTPSFKWSLNDWLIENHEVAVTHSQWQQLTTKSL